jgi:hypothetical protein
MEENTIQATTSRADTVFALFGDRPQANAAIEALAENGYNAKDVSVIMKDGSQTTIEGNSIADDAAAGALTGGALGALTGLLVGVGAIAIPGIGGLLVGGPLVAALGLTGAAATTATGAITGALAGGLLAGLISLGVPEEQAHMYEQRIKEGAVLVAVPTTDRLSFAEVRNILHSSGADTINEVHA